MMDEIFVSPEALCVMFYTHLHMMKNTLCVFCVGDICDLAHDSCGGES